MKFSSIFADEHGETHFSQTDLPERELAVGPPPNPVGKMSNFGTVTTMNAISFPAGTEAPAHTAPQPYVVIVLGGEGEVVVSNGESWRFLAGDLLVCNDLVGKSIVSRTDRFGRSPISASYASFVSATGSLMRMAGCMWGTSAKTLSIPQPSRWTLACSCWLVQTVRHRLWQTFIDLPSC